MAAKKTIKLTAPDGSFLREVEVLKTYEVHGYKFALHKRQIGFAISSFLTGSAAANGATEQNTEDLFNLRIEKYSKEEWIKAINTALANKKY